MIKLFCLPYAGGSSVLYTKWKRNLLDIVDLSPVEIAGRGHRMNDPFYQSIDEAVEDLFQQIKSALDKPYAFFGHSMGSLIVFELCRKIKEEGYPEPMHIFFSGREAPQTVGENYTVHNAPDEEFIQYVFQYGGMPESFLKNEMFLQTFIPILKADFKIVETYKFKEKDIYFNCGISVLYGKEDAKLDYANLEGWEKFTLKSCEFHAFEGGHFYINDNVETTVQYVNRKMQQLLIGLA